MPETSQRGAAKMRRPRGANAPSLSWDDLHIFLVCAEQGSFRRAAKALGIDAATVVRHIDKLEKDLGQRLLNRLTDGVNLTSEGRGVLSHARNMERASFNIVRESRMTDEGVRGLVRVAITEGLGTYWVLPRLLEFQKANRLLIFELQGTMELTDVGRLQADISIQFPKSERPDLITVRLGYLHTYPFVSEGYDREFGRPTSIAEVKSHRFIQQITPHLPDGVYERVLGVDSLEGIVGVRTNASSAVLYSVERGGGIGFLPSYALALGAKLLPVDIGMKNRLDIWMTYHPDIRHSRRHMIVVDWLRRIFDARRFPCFGEDFIHPSELVSLMTESAMVSGVDGFAAATPDIVTL
jgi:DNA-binding transcriptional LysR family regulator